MRRTVRDRFLRPFREQPVQMGLILIAVGLIDLVLVRGLGFGLLVADPSWLSHAPVLLLGAALVLYGRLRRPPAGGGP
jgi:hypothetical protein